jgi:hypothetical protein
MNIDNPSIKYGLYLSAFSILFTMVLYFIDKTLLFDLFIPPITLFIAGVICMVLAAREEKALDADGFLSYGDAVRVTFIVVAIASIIYAIFNYILFNYIDTGLLDIMQQETSAMVENILNIVGDEDAIEEAKAEINKQNFNYGFGYVIADVVGSLIFGIFKALIVAIFVKNTA